MNTNLMCLLRADGTICGGFAIQHSIVNIQDLILNQNWSELLTKREHRILDSVQLSKKFNTTSHINNITWRMELFPLEGEGHDFPAFSCLIERVVDRKLDSTKNEIANLRTIIDAMPFGVAVIRRDKRVHIMNQAALNLAGYSTMEEFDALQQPCQETFCPAPKGQCPVWDKGQLFDKTERPFLMRDGSSVQVLKTAVPIDINGEAMMLEGIIDLRKQKDLERLAYTDPLTGILNRKGMREKFNDVSDRIEIKRCNYTIMMFDLDNFKDVNDTYGHFAGDCVLRFFVRSMKKELQYEDVFCRWGGDEFLVITSSNIQECITKVQQVIARTQVVPCESDEWKNISLRFSVGIAAFELGMTLEQMVNKADGYMYHAKRNRIGIYHEEELYQCNN